MVGFIHRQWEDTARLYSENEEDLSVFCNHTLETMYGLDYLCMKSEVAGDGVVV